MKSRRRSKTRKKGVRAASAAVRPIPLQGILGYFQRALLIPVRVVEEKPKTSAAVLGVLLIAALATHGLTVNPFQAAPPPTAQLTFFATDNTGYLEFMDLANQSGDIILTQGQSILLNASQSYIIMFVPYNQNTIFQSWSSAGDVVLTPGSYMTNMTLTTNATLVAIASTPSIPIPEFTSGFLVIVLAFATILPVVLRRQATVHQNHSPTNT